MGIGQSFCPSPNAFIFGYISTVKDLCTILYLKFSSGHARANGYIITSLFFGLYSIWLFDFWTLNLVCLVIAAHLLDLLMLIFCCQSGLIVIGLLLISIICLGVGACDAVTGRGQGSFFCGVGAGHLDTAPPSCLPYFLSIWFT